MRTAQDNPPTKLKIMEVAQGLMIAQGYEATSVDEICQKAGAAKGSFFHYFKNKEELAKALIDQFSDKMGQAFCCAADDAGKDPLDRIYACLDFCEATADDPQTKGCLVGTLSQEISQTHPKMREECGRRFSSSLAFFAKELTAAKKQYAPKASFDPKELAGLFVSMMQGAFVLMKATRNPSVIKSNVRHFRSYLKQLYGR